MYSQQGCPQRLLLSFGYVSHGLTSWSFMRNHKVLVTRNESICWFSSVSPKYGKCNKIVRKQKQPAPAPNKIIQTENHFKIYLLLMDNSHFKILIKAIYMCKFLWNKIKNSSFHLISGLFCIRQYISNIIEAYSPYENFMSNCYFAHFYKGWTWNPKILNVSQHRASSRLWNTFRFMVLRFQTLILKPNITYISEINKIIYYFNVK